MGNDPAIALYRRFGLAPVGVRPDYYPEGGDALIMWAREIDSDDYVARLWRSRSSLSPGIEVERRIVERRPLRSPGSSASRPRATRPLRLSSTAGGGSSPRW